MKTTTYIRCFTDMSLYNDFNEENKARVLWEKIGIMLENKNVVNRVSVLRKIVRLEKLALLCKDPFRTAARCSSSRWATSDWKGNTYPW